MIHKINAGKTDPAGIFFIDLFWLQVLIWVKIGDQPVYCLDSYTHKIKQKYKDVKNIFGFKKFVQFLL